MHLIIILWHIQDVRSLGEGRGISGEKYGFSATKFNKINLNKSILNWGYFPEGTNSEGIISGLTKQFGFAQLSCFGHFRANTHQ